MFFPIFCIIGLYFAFYGLKYSKITFFFSGHILGFLISMVNLIIKLFCVDFILDRLSGTKILIICIIVCFLIGLIVGFFTQKFIKLGFTVIGGWLGYIISLILYASLLYKIPSNPENVIILL